MSFYSNFLTLCNFVGKTPSKAVLEIGLKKSAVTRWKNGGNPTDATAQRIADYFNVPVSSLFDAPFSLPPEQTKKPATVSGDELDETTREIMNILSDLTPEELALVKSRILKIIESR